MNIWVATWELTWLDNNPIQRGPSGPLRYKDKGGIKMKKFLIVFLALMFLLPTAALAKRGDRDRDRNRRHDSDRGRYEEQYHGRHDRGRHLGHHKHYKKHRHYHYRGHYDRHRWPRYYNNHHRDFRRGHYHRDDRGRLMFSFQDPNGVWFSFSIGD